MAKCMYTLYRGSRVVRSSYGGKMLKKRAKRLSAVKGDAYEVVRTCGSDASAKTVYRCSAGVCAGGKKRKKRKSLGRTKQTAKKTLSGWASWRRQRGERS